MSKKSKKKNKMKYFPEDGDAFTKRGKKDKSKKKKGPKTHDVKPSVSKKEGKKAMKIVMKPVKVPEAFFENRVKCNHADGTMTVAKFKALNSAPTAFTPMLQKMIDTFGENNVLICERCGEALVKGSCIRSGDVDHAISILYAGMNKAVAATNLSKDEIKSLNKLRLKIVEARVATDILAASEEAEGDNQPNEVPDSTPANSGVAFLN